MAYPTILLVLATILPVFGLALSTIFKRRTPFKGTRYPPGPPGKPLIEKVANDLLRTRGSIYSSRENLPAASIVLSDNLRPLFFDNDDKWRDFRRFTHNVTNSTVVGKYEFTQGLESVRTIRDLIQEPAEYERWFGRYSSGIIFRLGFGKTIQTGQEPVVREVFHVVHNLERVASPGAYLVDVFPWMLSLPKFLAPWRRELEKLHEIELKLFRRLFNDVKMGMKTGTAPQCWERDFIQNSADYNLTEDEAAYVMGSLFEAGSDSTSAVMMTILFSTVHHPEWLGRMQAEVDSVCGASRLPTMADVPNLPGMRAVVKEVMRWLPVTPGGVPHKSSKDDMYDGYFIPAGTNLHPVQWAIHRDPEIYPDPETFRPERWLDPSFPTYREPLTLHPHLHDYSAFGHGRRICPGQNIAERSLYLLTARLAWACDISPKKSDSGQPILPRFDNFTSGLAVQPRWFPFDLNPRDSGRIKVLDAEILRNAENDPLKGQL